MSGNDPLIGKQLGDYVIQSVLGQGVMARVYKGYDARLDRFAAVKVIEPTLTSSDEDEEYRERFQKEARAIARLNHPRVVGVYQFNNIDHVYYMAMVFIEGHDLRTVLKEYARHGKQLSHKQVLRIIGDIAQALDYSHAQGVIHRDIKPSNIMVTADGHAVLTDFGLALNASEGTIGNTFGSVHYIAPEQAMSSAQAVPQSDLYSLGVVLYEVLVGRVPFEDVSAMTVALKHISDPPPPPSTLNPEISPQIEEVVMKILDKDPQKRYPSGKAFIYALEGAFATSSDDDTQGLEDKDVARVSAAQSTASRRTATPPKRDEEAIPLIMSPVKSTEQDDVPTVSDSSKARPPASKTNPSGNSKSRTGLFITRRP
jgi:serine/threonine protein kinase